MVFFVSIILSPSVFAQTSPVSDQTRRYNLDGPVFIFADTIPPNEWSVSHATVSSRTVRYTLMFNANDAYTNCFYGSAVATYSGAGVSCSVVSSGPSSITIRCRASTTVDERNPILERRPYSITISINELTCTRKDGTVRDFNNPSKTIGYGFNWIHVTGWENPLPRGDDRWQRPDPDGNLPIPPRWELVTGGNITFNESRDVDSVVPK